MLISFIYILLYLIVFSLSVPCNFFKSVDRKKTGVKVIPFIISHPHEEKDRRMAGLENASYREKANILLDQTNRFRNRIVPCPVDGLKALLQEGISKGKDAFEKNWCSLQLALLLIRERADKVKIKQILNKTIRGEADGKIIIKDQDRTLLEVFSLQ